MRQNYVSLKRYVICDDNRYCVRVVVMAHKLTAIFQAQFTELVPSTECSGIQHFPCVDIYLVGLQMVMIHQQPLVHHPLLKQGITMVNFMHINLTLDTCRHPSAAVPVNFRSVAELRYHLLRNQIMSRFLRVAARCSLSVTDHSTFPAVAVTRQRSDITNRMFVAGQITRCRAISTRRRVITARDPYLPCLLLLLVPIVCQAGLLPSVRPLHVH